MLRLSHHINAQLEVFERLPVADVEEVAALAVGHDGTVLDPECRLVLVGFLPAVEGLAVEEGFEAGLDVGGGKAGEGKRETKEADKWYFHGRELARAATAKAIRNQRADSTPRT
jgi:hypothetical protein